MPLTQTVFALIICTIVFLLTVELVRKRRLREEYSVLWLVTSVVMFILVLRYDWLVSLTSLIGAALPTTTLFLGAVTTALAFAFAARLPLAPQHQGLLLVPAAIATITTGFLVLTTRKKAITQVIGYLILENGIFIFGLLLSEAMPVMVEAGVLLDLIVGIFVMGIIINQISHEFSSIDTSRLTALREEE